MMSLQLLLEFLKCESRLEHKLFTHFLNIILFVYKMPGATTTERELTDKLEPAFMCGLRSRDPKLRAAFFDMYDTSKPRDVAERLAYIFRDQDWGMMGHHFYIRECTNLLIICSARDRPLATPTQDETVGTKEEEDKTVVTSDVPVSVKGLTSSDLLKDHQQRFLQTLGAVGGNDVLNPLMNIISADTDVAAAVWLELFPKVKCPLSS